MIYFDNASTSYPKPKEVRKAVQEALETTANPGRGAHQLSREAARLIFEARESLAGLLEISDSKNIIFTCNATEGLNLGLKGLLQDGDHVITSSMEHSSVGRPLKHLEKTGIRVTKISYDPVKGLDFAELSTAVKSETKLISVMHMSNVNGLIFPLTEIVRFCKERKLLLLVDGAQAAGHLVVEPEKLGIDIYAFSGHKGLFGPTGTGALYISPDLDLPELKEGGTGGASEELEQLKIRPDRYESGTPNVSGIAGLGAGVNLIRNLGLDEIRQKEEHLANKLIAKLEKISNIKLCTSKGEQGPVFSLNLEGFSSAELAFKLEKEYNIATRAGLHCAPDAHRSLGTFPSGSVRISLNYFNEQEEVEKLAEALSTISRQ